MGPEFGRALAVEDDFKGGFSPGSYFQSPAGPEFTGGEIGIGEGEQAVDDFMLDGLSFPVNDADGEGGDEILPDFDGAKHPGGGLVGLVGFLGGIRGGVLEEGGEVCEQVDAVGEIGEEVGEGFFGENTPEKAHPGAFKKSPFCFFPIHGSKPPRRCGVDETLRATSLRFSQFLTESLYPEGFCPWLFLSTGFSVLHLPFIDSNIFWIIQAESTGGGEGEGRDSGRWKGQWAGFTTPWPPFGKLRTGPSASSG